MFKNYKCVVVLINSKTSEVGHYAVLTKFPKYIEYFSSLGGSPLKEAKELGQRGSVLLKLLGKNYVYNSNPLQKRDSTIEDCALWVLCRIRLRKLKLRQFQELFNSRVNLQASDDIMAMMTILLGVAPMPSRWNAVQHYCGNS